MNTIFEAEKEKFNMTDDEMEAMKVLVIKQFLKEKEENEKNDSPNIAIDFLYWACAFYSTLPDSRENVVLSPSSHSITMDSVPSK